MSKINFLPPWVETNLQPAFYDLESGTSLQQTSRMYAKVNQLIRSVNDQNDTIADYVQQFLDLKDYVDDYFDNLDVQTEINNKLDAMVEDGTIKSIINSEIFAEINNKVLQNTVDISANTDALAGKVSQGEASSITMEMLTQDVREALTGGSTAVVAENSVDTVNIVDKAITILKLDDYLQSTKIITAGEAKALGVKSGGIAQENAGTHKIEIAAPTSTDYSWYKVALTKGKFYYFSGYNYGTCGFYIADSSDNVKFNSVTAPTTYSDQPYSLLFRADEANLYAYIDIREYVYTTSNKSVLRINTPILREITSIDNKFKEIAEPTLLSTTTGGYMSVEVISATHIPRYEDYSTGTVYIYSMSKGVKYNVKGNDWSAVCGLYILKLDNTVIYQSSDESVGNNLVPFDYTFVADEDGYIVITDVFNNTHSVEVLQDYTIEYTPSDLSFSKWYALGDSLTEVNFRASTNYVGYIEDELGISVTNLGHSGSGYKKVSGGQTLVNQVNSLSGYNYNTDVITVMGSINDFEYITGSLGELGDTTTDTIYGAMYNFFSTLQSSKMGTRIGVITPPVIGTSYNAQRENFAKYNKALKETAELFGIPVLDLTYSCNLKPWESTFRNEFYSADGIGGSGQVDDVHPNSKGHWLIHNKIKEFLKTL